MIFFSDIVCHISQIDHRRSFKITNTFTAITFPFKNINLSFLCQDFIT